MEDSIRFLPPPMHFRKVHRHPESHFFLEVSELNYFPDEILDTKSSVAMDEGEARSQILME